MEISFYDKVITSSERGIDFIEFVQQKMLPHIDEYTIPQYGDIFC